MASAVLFFPELFLQKCAVGSYGHVVIQPESKSTQHHIFSSLDWNNTQEMALVRCNSNPGHPRDHVFGILVQVAASNTRPMDERVLNIRITIDSLKWRLQMQERMINVW